MKLAPRGQIVTPTQRCPITIIPAPHQRSAAPPVVILSDTDNQELLSQTRSPRRSPRAMSTPHQTSKSSTVQGQGSPAILVSKVPSTLQPSSVPLDSTIDSLDASNTSMATLPAEDTSATRTPSLRSRYVVLAPPKQLVSEKSSPDQLAGPSCSSQQVIPQTVNPTSTDIDPQTKAAQIQPVTQDDVDSQVSSSSSTRAPKRTRKAPARYGSPVRPSVTEVKENVATSPSIGHVAGGSPVTPKRRFIRRNTEDFIQPSSSSARLSSIYLVSKTSSI